MQPQNLPGTVPPIGWGAQPPGPPLMNHPPPSPVPGLMPFPASQQQPPFQPHTQQPPFPPLQQPAFQPPQQPAFQPPVPPPTFQSPSSPAVQQPAFQSPAVPATQPTPFQPPVQPPVQQPAAPPVTQPSVQHAPAEQRTLFDNSQPVAAQVAQPAAAPPSKPSIQQLLKLFSKIDTCTRYSADSEKIKLLEDYLLVRQLTPSLSFELFLELYAPIADFTEENLKRPADAIKHYLPRAKKTADERGMHHWAAKEVVDYVALYVDMIRDAESQASPIPMTLNEFLQSKAMIDGFLAGAFKEEPAPKEPAAKQPKSKTPRAPGGGKAVPTANDQRVIYTSGSGRQHRGRLTAYWRDDQSGLVFADFRADSGEEFKGVGINSFELCTDPPPNSPQTIEGDPLPELGHGKLTIVKAQFPAVLQALSVPVAMGTVAIGDTIHRFHHQFSTGHVAVIEVVNGEAGPFVDARLCLNTFDNVLAEINPPRKNIEGIYVFETQEGTFNLEVVGNK